MNQYGLAGLLFGISAVCLLVYGIYQHISLMFNRDKIAYTNGVIIDTSTVVPETMKIYNSRWASVSFQVEGRQYASSKRIQVPMNFSVGDEVKIAYFKDNPSRIFTASWKKAIIFSIIGILCLIMMVYFANQAAYKI